MHRLYSVALALYFLVLLPVVAYRRIRRGHRVDRFGDRLGRLPAAINHDRRRSVWIHAVSVGEVLAARTLLGDVRRAYPDHAVFVSTTTVTGQHVARQLGDRVDGVFYAPIDWMPCVTRALDRLRPDLMLFVDTELWPNWLLACRRRGIATAVVNGRISDRSYRTYRLARFFMRRVLHDLDRVCAQTATWGARFIDLGLPADRMTVTGSLKFDALDQAGGESDRQNGDPVLRAFAFTRARPVLVAASTLDGEDEPVLDAFTGMRATAPEAVLILAPRHPERAKRVMALATRAGFAPVLRSRLPVDASSGPAVVVLDTVGELPRLFRVATLVFVGGSLVDAGGHNIIEPASFGKPIVFGPHMSNFAEAAALFVASGGAIQVQTSRALREALVRLSTDPAGRQRLGKAARAVVEANRGARARHLAVLADLLPPACAAPDSDVRPSHIAPQGGSAC